MEYKKVPGDSEMQMHTFDPIVQYKAPPKPFDDRDDDKDKRNKGKEKRISISLIILTFLSSVCVLFGTLYPELSRGEIDMTPWRSMIQASVQRQGWLIRDRITLVNLGLWRYCYDDQLYDLIEILNPQFSNLGRRRRSAEEEEEEHFLAKRQIAREGDIAIRCHNVPAPWKMPYHVKNKTEATKVCLIIGIVTCILSFLISILVLITRLPLLKLFQLISCFLGAVSISVALGVSMTMQTDAQKYFNESIGRKVEQSLKVEADIDLTRFGLSLTGIDVIELAPGVCGIMLGGSCILMIVSVIIAEISRHQ
ncbi:uncharacterized protein LOC134825285 isoform X4 [Bolinopsis microptera]|uniref:uncharacterized protein LOC134825285 isoform X4 n=1 Tax=Bolinopsis microptera TaxID=2820187 RepID=UPI0030790B7A